MSNLLYPVLPGLTWSKFRTPMWNTTLKSSDSGRDFSRTTWTSPRWVYRLQYSVLRAGAQQELQTLAAFFNRHAGDHDTWLFDDPDDNTVTFDQFGLGDSVTTTFQLVRSMGGYLEPVYELNGVPVITQTDWQGAWAMATTPRANLFRQSAADSNLSPWSKGVNLARVGNTAAPDGSNTATIYQTSSTGNAYLLQSVALTGNGVYALSCWAKLLSGTAPTLGTMMGVDRDTDGNAATAERVNRDWLGLDGTWKRFSLVVSNMAFMPTASVFMAADWGNGAQIAFWGAQIEDTGWRAGGALVFGTRSTTAPDGSGDAVKLVEDNTAAAGHYAQKRYVITAGAAASFDWYVKAGERTVVAFENYSDPTPTQYANVLFNSATGAFSATNLREATMPSLSATDLGGGWWKVSMQVLFTGSISAMYQRVALCSGAFGSATTVYNGDGSSGAYVWRADGMCQPTRYIPTTTVARTVTDVTVGSLGQVTFGDAPLAGALLSWAGKFYWRCRFTKSSMELEQFMKRLWSAKTVEFKTDKP
jgi:hypothetical protein